MHLFDCCNRAAVMSTLGLLFFCKVAWTEKAACAQWAERNVESEFTGAIVPFLKTQCESCHSGAEPEARFDVTDFYDQSEVGNLLNSWQFLVSRVAIGDMPPADQSDRPSEAEIEQLVDWTKHFRRWQARKTKGDPGSVSMRRLNHAEYNYTIRDLTGQHIQPASSFPIDPTNEAGFDNSAESLMMTPALVSKYLDAARFVAEHLLLVPQGIRFAPHPVVTETDRDKYCVQRIVDFYRRQPTDISSYFLACWQATKQGLPLEEIARLGGISPKYLRIVHSSVNDSSYSFGPMAELVDRWNSEVLACNSEREAETACQALAEFVEDCRQKLTPQVPSLSRTSGLNQGSQTVILWRNRKVAELRQTCREDIFDTAGEDSPLLERDRPHLADHRNRIMASYSRFCEIFPDAFMITERGRHYSLLKKIEGKGRLLSAGFHSMMGYFRDDGPLVQLILDEHGREELDTLWRELELIAMTPMRQYAGFLWFERAEASFINEPQFQFVRAEDKGASSEEMIRRLSRLFLEKIQRGEPTPELIEAVTYYFEDMDRQIRSVEEELLASEPRQLESLIEFAGKAFRRPLTEAEKDSLRNFYQSSRELPAADHRSAMEDTLVTILVSPHFLYRWDLRTDGTQARPLSGSELASRLSFFLWSSAPDEILLDLVRSGILTDPDQLKMQTNRLLDDPRSKRMVREFLGNWLDFRRFDSHAGVDRERFLEFNDQVRAAMAREPVEYFWDLLQSGGTLDELISSNHMVLSPVLAEHYGVGWPHDRFDQADDLAADQASEEAASWIRLEGAKEAGRGGLLSMGVFLTQNSPGLRTSPVKRGYWVVRKLLGEKIPPPPPNVPELPDSEHDTGELTLRELLARHREHPSCAACHNRFDSAGLLLEGFDPIGRPRTEDMAGRPVSAAATLPEGFKTEGIAGLTEYILSKRMEDFRRNFCENLVAYALGRTLIVSDDLLVEEMLQRLNQNGNRIRAAFELIVESPQFLRKRAGTSANSPVASIPNR
jgi:hypothetical protein